MMTTGLAAAGITSQENLSRESMAREMTVARADGVTVLRRTFRGWSNVPPPIPPFAAMSDRFAVTPAVVLAKGDRVLALLGSPGSSKSEIALALIPHGWRVVSGQVLVSDRRTGRTMPFLTPLEFRGAAAERVRRQGLPEGCWRAGRSALGEEMLQVRPEAVGGIVPVRSQGGPPTLVKLCHSDNGVQLQSAEFSPQVWPAEARSTLRNRGTFQLRVPAYQAAEEAANSLDAEFAPAVGEDRKVVPIKPFLPAPRG